MSLFPFVRVAPGVAAILVFIFINFTANADTAGTSAAAADPTAAAGDASAQGLGASALPPIIVTAQHLDDRRTQIQTQTGADTYTVDAAAIAQMPAGDNTLLNQVILQMPEVAQDSFGQFHIRGEHNGLQYRVNGIILPEGISVFGQALDPRFISSMSLITGALPAEFGLRTAGIIDITTKSGIQAPGGAVPRSLAAVSRKRELLRPRRAAEDYS
jgi:outer membrane receptor for ferrienterochelin and colicins